MKESTALVLYDARKNALVHNIQTDALPVCLFCCKDSPLNTTTCSSTVLMAMPEYGKRSQIAIATLCKRALLTARVLWTLFMQ